MMSQTPPCQALEWDSNFFDLRIARLLASQLSPARVQQAHSWCRDHRIDCLYFLCDAHDHDSHRLAEADGFTAVDQRTTLALALTAPPAQEIDEARIRPATPGDLATLASIASRSHCNTRFYVDGHFSRERCDELYATWIRKSCEGDADHVLVSALPGQPACGYMTCHLDTPETGRIGLVAVAEAARGQGLARALLNAAIATFSEAGIRTVTVVTQGANKNALHLYQKAGFIISREETWFHRWYRE